MPYYIYEEFKKACGEDMVNVIPINSVMKDAQELFNLYPKSVLLDLINNDGLEELEFINTKPWERNPDKGNTIFVDAYEFRTLNKLGYISFMRNNKTMKWLIKSFHLSDNKNPVMLIAMQRAGLLGKYKEKS